MHFVEICGIVFMALLRDGRRLALFSRGQLLDAGYDCWYMSWADDSKTLRRYANVPDAFDQKAYKLLHSEVLYIDDLMKATAPTEAEKLLAFQIINARYRTNRITLISSEWLLDDLVDLDEATGSRILEKAGTYVVNVRPDRAKNYRTRKAAHSAGGGSFASQS